MFRIVVALVFVMLGGMVFVGCREDSGGGERREDGNGDAFLVGFAEVRDGDSFLLGGEEVRLLGIDAPEYDQECGEGEDIWRCGEVAKGMLAGVGRGAVVREVCCFFVDAGGGSVWRGGETVRWREWGVVLVDFN